MLLDLVLDNLLSFAGHLVSRLIQILLWVDHLDKAALPTLVFVLRVLSDGLPLLLSFLFFLFLYLSPSLFLLPHFGSLGFLLLSRLALPGKPCRLHLSFLKPLLHLLNLLLRKARFGRIFQCPLQLFNGFIIFHFLTI